MWKYYGKAGQITDDSTKRRMRFSCWIAKHTDTHSEYVIFIDNNVYANASQCYFIHALPV